VKRERASEKRFIEAKEIASRNMGARKQYSTISFLGGFIEGISSMFIANVSTPLFFIAGKASRVHKITYHFSSIVEQLLKLSTMCKSPSQGSRNYREF